MSRTMEQVRAEWASNQWQKLPAATRKELLPVIAAPEAERNTVWGNAMRNLPDLTRWECGALVDMLKALFAPEGKYYLESIKCQN